MNTKLSSPRALATLLIIVLARTCSLAFVYSLAWLAVITVLFPLEGWLDWLLLLGGIAFVWVQSMDALKPLLENLRQLRKRIDAVRGGTEKGDLVPIIVIQKRPAKED